jgi:hypothetical protein
MALNSTTGVVSASQVNGQGGYAVTIQVTDSASPSQNSATATLNFGVYSDTSLAGCQIFPADSIYNQRVDQLPVDTTPSHQIPSSHLNSPLHPDFGYGFYPGPGGIPWMRVAAKQPATNVNLSASGQIDAAGHTPIFAALLDAARNHSRDGERARPLTKDNGREHPVGLTFSPGDAPLPHATMWLNAVQFAGWSDCFSCFRPTTSVWSCDH